MEKTDFLICDQKLLLYVIHNNVEQNYTKNPNLTKKELNQ